MFLPIWIGQQLILFFANYLYFAIAILHVTVLNFTISQLNHQQFSARNSDFPLSQFLKNGNLECTSSIWKRLKSFFPRTKWCIECTSFWTGNLGKNGERKLAAESSSMQRYSQASLAKELEVKICKTRMPERSAEKEN